MANTKVRYRRVSSSWNEPPQPMERLVEVGRAKNYVMFQDEGHDEPQLMTVKAWDALPVEPSPVSAVDCWNNFSSPTNGNRSGGPDGINPP